MEEACYSLRVQVIGHYVGLSEREGLIFTNVKGITTVEWSCNEIMITLTII